jgi:hypothetical protein
MLAIIGVSVCCTWIIGALIARHFWEVYDHRTKVIARGFAERDRAADRANELYDRQSEYIRRACLGIDQVCDLIHIREKETAVMIAKDKERQAKQEAAEDARKSDVHHAYVRKPYSSRECYCGRDASHALHMPKVEIATQVRITDDPDMVRKSIERAVMQALKGSGK